MYPIIPKRFGLTRGNGWNGSEYSMRMGKRRPGRTFYDHPPLKLARIDPSDFVRESYGRPPSLLESSFSINNSCDNFNRKQQSPPLREKYCHRDQSSLESWRIANESLPVRRASGAWVKPGGRLSSGVTDAVPKNVSQRVIQAASSLSSKPMQGSSTNDDHILTSDVVPERTRTRGNDVYDDEDQARLAKIRSDLERMKQEDKEGYELLVKVLASSNDSDGSPQFTAERKEHLVEDSFSTKGFIHRPDYEMKVEEDRKFQEKSDYPKRSRSPSAPNSNPVRPPVAVKESDKKLHSLLDIPTLTSKQPRWESWRNLSSGKAEASVRPPWKGNPVPPADSWRTSTVSPMASSWRNTSKTNPGSSSLKHGQSLELDMRSDLEFTQRHDTFGEPFRKPTSFMSKRLQPSKGKIPFRR